MYLLYKKAKVTAMMAAITFTFFFRIATSSSVTARLFFAWIRLILTANSSFRTGKNKTIAKINDVIPYQDVSMSFTKKGPRIPGKSPWSRSPWEVFG
mgnify:CR=1 FL=1